MHSAPQICKNCGNSFAGAYCNQCGEKVYTDHDKSIKHVFEEIFHFVTHFEGKFLTTLKAIFITPGKLAFDYCNGVRKKYFKPVSFFLLCIVLYLLFPRFPGLNMKLNTYVSEEYYNFTAFTRPVVKKKMQSSSLTYQQVADKYDKESGKVSKIFLLMMIPLMAIPLSLLFFSRYRYFFDHFMVATEIGSLYIIIIFLLMPLVMVAGSFVYPPFKQFFVESNDFLILVMGILLYLYVVIAFKRFYGQTWLWTFLKGIVFLSIFIFVTTPVYHYLLFRVVMLLI